MKKLISTMILIALAFTTNFAQINFEGSHNASLKAISFEGETVKYILKAPGEDKIVIYNEDHTVWKRINLSIPKDHKLDEIKHISINTLNKDQYVEVIYTSYLFTTKDDIEVAEHGYFTTIPRLYVINELGEILLEVNYSDEFKIIEVHEARKLLVYQKRDDDFIAQNKTLIYNIGKTK